MIYHLIEDSVFETHLDQLFGAARRSVVSYSSDTDEQLPDNGDSPHVRPRKFTSVVQQRFPGWKLVERIPNPFPYSEDPINGSFADFYIYARQD